MFHNIVINQHFMTFYGSYWAKNQTVYFEKKKKKSDFLGGHKNLNLDNIRNFIQMLKQM